MMLSQDLRAMKERSGMTSHELASAADIPESTLSRILTGECTSPSFDNVSRLVKAMNGSLDELTGMQPPPAVAPSVPPPLPPELIASFSSQLNNISDRIVGLEQGSAHMVTLARSKDRWIFRMFVYCIVLTFIVTSVLIFLCLCFRLR